MQIPRFWKWIDFQRVLRYAWWKCHRFFPAFLHLHVGKNEASFGKKNGKMPDSYWFFKGFRIALKISKKMRIFKARTARPVSAFENPNVPQYQKTRKHERVWSERPEKTVDFQGFAGRLDSAVFFVLACFSCRVFFQANFAWNFDRFVLTFEYMESCPSGRRCSTRNAVGRKASRVRIPNSPPHRTVISERNHRAFSIASWSRKIGICRGYGYGLERPGEKPGSGFLMIQS